MGRDAGRRRRQRPRRLARLRGARRGGDVVESDRGDGAVGRRAREGDGRRDRRVARGLDDFRAAGRGRARPRAEEVALPPGAVFLSHRHRRRAAVLRGGLRVVPLVGLQNFGDLRAVPAAAAPDLPAARAARALGRFDRVGLQTVPVEHGLAPLRRRGVQAFAVQPGPGEPLRGLLRPRRRQARGPPRDRRDDGAPAQRRRAL
mmetsp:Transcript_36883/g.112855  ORF Transcript_36883/g.112855 Transcript_36883/m.112855 type:complete len:203 (+) Transcript_36883:568-1176(+)